jgi:hypothetical protein
MSNGQPCIDGGELMPQTQTNTTELVSIALLLTRVRFEAWLTASGVFADLGDDV